MSMTTAYWPISVRRGQTDDTTWAFAVDDEPVDLTGYTFVLDVRDGKDEDATLILRITSEEPDPGATYPLGTFTVDGEAGTVRRLIPADVTATLEPGAYLYDLKITQADAVTVDYYLSGPFTVARRITP